MKHKIQLIFLALVFFLCPCLQSQELHDNEIKDAVSLSQLIINRALNDGSEKPLFIMVGRGPAPLDILLDYAGFDVAYIPLSIKSELQRRRIGNKEISIKKEIQEGLNQLFPASKIDVYDKIVLFDYWCMGDTLGNISDEFSNYLISLGKKDVALDIMALTSKRPNISLILMHPDYKEILEPKTTHEVIKYLEKELVHFLKKRERGLDSFLRQPEMPNVRSFSLLANPAFAYSMMERKNVDYARYKSTILPFQFFLEPITNPDYPAKRLHILSKINLIKELREERGKTPDTIPLVQDDYRILDFWEYSRAVDANKKLMESQGFIEETKIETDIIPETEEEPVLIPEKVAPVTPQKKSLCKKILSFFSVFKKPTQL
jgi:hypothetical protein